MNHCPALGKAGLYALANNYGQKRSLNKHTVLFSIDAGSGQTLWRRAHKSTPVGGDGQAISYFDDGRILYGAISG